MKCAVSIKYGARIGFVLVLAFGAAINANAEPEFWLHASESLPGQTADLLLGIRACSEPYSGVNAKIVLPEIVSGVEAGNPYGLLSGGGYAVACRTFTQNGALNMAVVAFSENRTFDDAGALVRLRLRIAPNASAGVPYPVAFSDTNERALVNSRYALSNDIPESVPITIPGPLELSVVQTASPPFVSRVLRAGNSSTQAGTADFLVLFSKDVLGVDASDFLVASSEGEAPPGASVTQVSGEGMVYRATLATGDGEGGLSLVVADNDSIVDTSNQPLGGTGVGNGDFESGETYFVDRIPPAITLEGEADVSIGEGSEYTDAGATAADNYDGDITGRMVLTGEVNTAVLGDYTLTYSVADSAGNAATPVARMVHVVSVEGEGEVEGEAQIEGEGEGEGEGSILDTVAPVIILEGEPEMTLEAKVETYVEPGAQALDDWDGDISSRIDIEGEVNDTLLGDYALTYSVSDAAGNAAMPVTRTVHVVDRTPPIIELEGEIDMLWAWSQPFVEPGYSAWDIYDEDLTSFVDVFGTVDENVVAAYSLQYSVNDSSGNPAVPVTRLVHVVDDSIPVIQLWGSPEMTLEAKVDQYVEPGAAASDALDGDISDGIAITGEVNPQLIGDYTVAYNVQDAAGNAAPEVIRVVHVRDTRPPVITRLGEASIMIEAGAVYTDAGATAFDLYDGDLTGQIVVVNKVNTAQPGIYNVRYTVSDSSGNQAAPVTRIVQVLPAAPGEEEGESVEEGEGENKALRFLGCGGSELPSGQGAVDTILLLGFLVLLAFRIRAHYPAGQ